MASTQELETIISVGLLGKWSLAGVSALWFYDYFLTLADEIEWGWSGRKPWGSALFVLNRYWPVWWLSWNFPAWSPKYMRPMCRKTSWVTVLYLVVATFFAQVVVTLRAYAVTGEKRWVASCLSLITLGQLGVGIYLTVTYAFQPMMELPDLPLDGSLACLPQPMKTREIIYPSISIGYDTLALAFIIYSARGWARTRFAGVPSLFGAVLKNATSYFLIVFANHLAVICSELFDLRIQGLPPCLITVMMPMMTTRLWLSLRKAANPLDSTSANVGSLRFAYPEGRAGPSKSYGKS